MFSRRSLSFSNAKARRPSPESSRIIPPAEVPIVLSIAGYDPSAGAGVLADLKTFSSLNVYGMACVTAMTVQSTLEVRRVIPLEPGLVLETLDCLARDVSFAAIKVGMLGSIPVARAVADWLSHQPKMLVLLDPVLKSSSGKDLLEPGGVEVLREHWLARASWMKPNRQELAILTNTPIANDAQQIEAAAASLQRLAAQKGNTGLKVIVTGGDAETPNDLLRIGENNVWLSGAHIETNSTHGTGCTFSSALAAHLALGYGEEAAVRAAKKYVSNSLQHSYPIGKGKGPLNHFLKKT